MTRVVVPAHTAACRRALLSSRVPALRSLLLLTLVMAGGGCKRPVTLPTTVVPAAKIRTVADVPPDREPAEGQTRVLGNGWYANVEVDARDRLHLAWTDADLGDVMYAVVGGVPAEPPAVDAAGQQSGDAKGAQTTTGDVPKGSADPLSAPKGTTTTGSEPDAIDPQVVEHQGAVGSYLRLALAPGDAPVLSYYDQDERTLRLAHRPADLDVMAAAGARLGDKVTTQEARARVPGEKPPPPPGLGMGEGWHGEEVAFGDNAGLAGALAVDDEGVPHLIYYTKNERLRYATRPAGAAAFGERVQGVFDKQDVDDQAGGSYTMSTDLVVTDGTVVASYCHWNYVDSQLKVALLPAGAEQFDIAAATPLRRTVDGWHSTLVPVGEGQVEVYSVATGEAKLLRGVLDVKRPAPFEERVTLLDRPGPTVVRRAPDGTLWILTRYLGLASLDEKAGVSLIELPGGDPAKARRFLLEEGLGRDPWIDLALRKDGTPVAVWTSRETLSMKLYVHEPG